MTAKQKASTVLREKLYLAYCNGRANNHYVPGEVSEGLLDYLWQAAQMERTPRTDLENELADEEYARLYREARIKTQREIDLCDWARKEERERIMKIFASFGRIRLKKPLSGKEFEALFD